MIQLIIIHVAVLATAAIYTLRDTLTMRDDGFGVILTILVHKTHATYSIYLLYLSCSQSSFVRSINTTFSAHEKEREREGVRTKRMSQSE